MTRVFDTSTKFSSAKKIADDAQHARANEAEHSLDIKEIIEYAARRIEDEPQKAEEPTGSKRTSGSNAETD